MRYSFSPSVCFPNSVSIFFSFSLEHERLTLVFLSAVPGILGDSSSSGLVISEGPVVSERRLDQEVALGLEEDRAVEVDVLKASVDLPEEKPPISDDPPNTQEIHVKKMNFLLPCQSFSFGLVRFQTIVQT